MSHCSCLSIRLKKQKNKQENKSRNKDAQVVSNWYFSEFLYNCEGKSRESRISLGKGEPQGMWQQQPSELLASEAGSWQQQTPPCITSHTHVHKHSVGQSS